MEKTKLQTFMNDEYRKWASDYLVWISNSKANEAIADLLHHKYESAHEKWRIVQESAMSPKSKALKKQIINPYLLGMRQPILMWYGASLECALKSLLILKGVIKPVSDHNGSPRLSKTIKTHDLSHLYKSAFNKEAPEVLEFFTNAVRDGKYYVTQEPRSRLDSPKLDQSVLFIKTLLKLTRKEISLASIKISGH